MGVRITAEGPASIAKAIRELGNCAEDIRLVSILTFAASPYCSDID